MSGYVDNEVTNRAVADSYRQFSEKVADIEQRIIDDVPLTGGADISDALKRSASAIETETRTARTVPVLNVYRYLTGSPVPQSLVSALTALDVIINAADDVIDTEPIENRDRVTYTSNILFGHLQLFANLDAPDAAISTLTEYYTAVAQIPRVEHRLQRQLIEASERGAMISTAREVYEYDSVDIEGFALLPATEYDIDAETAATLLDDFRTFRARHLLFEDVRHVERTAAQNDTNPVMYFAEKYDSAAMIAETLREVLSPLTYRGEGEYIAILEAAEREPDDLEAMVASCLPAR
jgi:hypothetical protein